MSVQETIANQLKENKIVLYMKGTPAFPQCGFSGRVAYILKELGVEYLAINVLEDNDIRQGIKEYGNWPTIPQLYVNGELLGGSDILQEMYDAGELQSKLSL